MCNDCDDSNITNIPSGPPGPTGPTGSTGATGATGPAPLITGTSSTSNTLSVGSKTFATQPGIAWVLGQRVIAANGGASKSMSGEITAYDIVTGILTINIDIIVGAVATITGWTLSITGNTGSTGPTGVGGYNAYGTTTGTATFLGSSQYLVPLSGTNASWMVAGQNVYFATAGYFQVVSIVAGVSATVLDLMYSGNAAGNLVSTSGLAVSPAGKIGATGNTGATGATGSTGPIGPQGPIANIILNIIAPTSITGITNVPVMMPVPITIITPYFGQLVFQSTAAVTITITPRVAGVSQTASMLTATGPTAVGGYSYIVIPVSDLQPFVSGDTFEFTVGLSDYTKSTTVSGRVNIQL